MPKHSSNGLVPIAQTVLLFLVIPMVIKPLWERFTGAEQPAVLGFATLADPWTVLVPVLLAIGFVLAIALLERAKRRD